MPGVIGIEHKPPAFGLGGKERMMDLALEHFMREREYNAARHVQDRIAQIVAHYKLPARATTELINLLKYQRDLAEQLFAVKAALKPILYGDSTE